MADEQTYLDFNQLLHGVEIFTRVDNDVQDELVRLQIDIRQEDVAFILHYLNYRRNTLFPGHGKTPFHVQYVEALPSMVDVEASND